MKYISWVFLLLGSCFGTNADWALINKAKTDQYALQFHIDFIDDEHEKFDYQTGLASFYPGEDLEIKYFNPSEKIIWRKGKQFGVYESVYDQVELNLKHINNESALFPLLQSMAQLKEAFDIEKKGQTIVLKSKQDHKAILVNQIIVHLDSKGHFKSYTVKDKLGYEAVVMFDSKTTQKIKNGIQVNYPKTAEVVNHDRYSKV